jgi:predicted glutamine amidotransferase
MCGIVYVRRKDGLSANKRVWKKYNKQRTRGNDGFGFIAIEGDTVKSYKRTMTEDKIEDALKAENSAHILFHHRFPTSTENLPESAHPIQVKHRELKYTYYVVHNGVITNDDTLREDHMKLGYTYTTAIEKQYRTAKGTIYTSGTEYNDSEALAIELARTIEGLQTEVRARGSMAVIILQCDKTGKKVHRMYYGRNEGNPLTVYEDDTQMCIASEGGKNIPSDTMFCYDLATGATTEEAVLFQPYAIPKSTMGYNYGHSYSNGYTGGYPLDDEEEDYAYGSKTITEPPLRAHDYSAEEYEQHLDDIEADITIARQAGEPEEVENLEIEREAILAEYHLFLDYEERMEGARLPVIS